MCCILYSDIPEIDVTYIAVKRKGRVTEQLADTSFEKPFLEMQSPQTVLCLYIPHSIHQVITVVGNDVRHTLSIPVDIEPATDVATSKLLGSAICSEQQQQE